MFLKALGQKITSTNIPYLSVYTWQEFWNVILTSREKERQRQGPHAEQFERDTLCRED